MFWDILENIIDNHNASTSTIVGRCALCLYSDTRVYETTHIYIYIYLFFVVTIGISRQMLNGGLVLLSYSLPPQGEGIYYFRKN